MQSSVRIGKEKGVLGSQNKKLPTSAQQRGYDVFEIEKLEF